MFPNMELGSKSRVSSLKAVIYAELCVAQMLERHPREVFSSRGWPCRDRELQHGVRVMGCQGQWKPHEGTNNALVGRCFHFLGQGLIVPGGA